MVSVSSLPLYPDDCLQRQDYRHMHSDSKSNSDGQHRIAPKQQASHAEGTIRYRNIIYQGAGIAQHSLAPKLNQEKLEAILPFPPMMHTTHQG